MIDPIRNPVYQDYQRQKQSKKIDGANTEKGKFNLDYAEEGVLYEPSSGDDEKAGETPKKETGSFQAAALSELKELTEAAPASAQKQTSSRSSVTDTLRAFFARALQVLHQLWITIWESRPADENAAVLTKEELNDALKDDGKTPDDPDPAADAGNRYVSDSPKNTGHPDGTAAAMTAGDPLPDITASAQDPLHAANDARILHALKSGDRSHFRSLLSEDGRRTPARNSSLLTYYDAKGNLISPDASVQQRVLHGDRGSMKR